MDKIEELYNLIKNSQKIVFFTGAGVSTSSGLSDFQSIYSKNYYGIDPVEIMTKGFLEKHPEIFFKFFKDYFFISSSPNICHQVIADIKNKWNKDVSIITQNIDGLHQKAGSLPVFEIHGTIKKWYCSECKKTFNIDEIIKLDSLKCGEEGCKGYIRPNMIFYNEDFNPMILKICTLKLQEADTLIVAGTSLNTLFAYELVKNFQGKVAFINRPLKESLPDNIDLAIYDDISNVFSQLKNFENEDDLSKT